MYILGNTFEELTAGILAAGAEKVWIMSLLPRISCRPGDFPVSIFSAATEADEHCPEEAVFTLLCLPTGGLCTFHPAR